MIPTAIVRFPCCAALGAAAAVLSSGSGCAQTHLVEAPRAALRAHESTVHGQQRSDPYYWLRNRDDRDVLAYLEAENAYTAARMKHTEPLQEKLFAELKSRLRETDSTVPARHGDYWYYQRTEAGLQYPVYCRKRGSLDASEEVLLDGNELAAGREHFEIGDVRVSPDHGKLAYTVDFTGREVFELRVKDLLADRVLEDAIGNVYYGLAWADDGRTVFYTTLDDALRPHEVHRHVVGTTAEEDRLVYREEDERFHATVERSRSGAYVFVELSSQITSEVLYIPAGEPDREPKAVRRREQGVEYSVDHRGDLFYVLTNRDATNFQLLSVPTANPSPQNWSVVIPHRGDVTLQSVSAFDDFLAIEQRRGGLSGIRVLHLKSGRDDELTFDEPAYEVHLGENLEFATRALRYEYSSLATPPSVYDISLDTQTREMLKRFDPPGYDPSRYEVSRLWATAPDGVAVPISLVRRRDRAGAGPSPLLLEGYGSYGISNDPSFSANVASLLDRGVSFAIAHVRGGGEMGRAWYLEGKLLKKRNSFTDFIACAEHLVREGHTAPDRLAIVGGSAGGLLMGAVANLRGDLFRCVVAHVPFVDVVNTMLDPTIPLTVIEYEEWGNPNERPFFDYMLSYSPYDNVAERAYPHMLVTAGLNDPRVQYWEPAKWVARLRAQKTDDNLLLLKTNMGAGHGGASGRYARLREVALEYAFVLDRLGISE